MTDRPLLLVALRLEAARLPDDVPCALIGAGKVSGATGTARALLEHRPSRVLNIGSAGALVAGYEGVHRIGAVQEHDFDHAALEALTGDPAPGPIVLDPHEPTTLVTGDVFVQDERVRSRLAERAHLVDMEGYAVARACAVFDVPLTMVKIVSDTAGDAAFLSWQESVDRTAIAIAEAAAAWLG